MLMQVYGGFEKSLPIEVLCPADDSPDLRRNDFARSLCAVENEQASQVPLRWQDFTEGKKGAGLNGT